jgi:hypothetical protein
MAAAYRLLANAFEMMRGRPTDESESGSGSGSGSGDNDLLANMIEVLRQSADDPPAELKGCPDSFLDELERVPNKSLKPTDTCPICVNPFLEGRWSGIVWGVRRLADPERGTDQYPLVVRLPCHKDHFFDLDCIRPWLKLNSTCPLDRKELLKKKLAPPPVEDDEEEYDDMYAWTI